MIELSKKLDRLDVYRAHLVDGAEITPTQEAQLEKYKSAFTWMAKSKSPGQAITKVEKFYGLSYSQAAKIVREAIKLYGDVNAYSKQGLRQLMYEKLLRMADRAEKAEDLRAAEKLLDKACRVMDLYNPKDAKGSGGTTVINLFFDDDPAILEEQGTIDAEHEEVDE